MVKGDWDSTFNNIMERQRKGGITHYLIVQGDDIDILLAALIPIGAVRPIWEKQREMSQSLIGMRARRLRGYPRLPGLSGRTSHPRRGRQRSGMELCSTLPQLPQGSPLLAQQ